ncbi:unnamed protein product [Linum trigynum]|uniref:Retrotransposon Copia-like N-terminal domain-containing protein n=1 Tax=Linum trigynum TaxID=586398 RepID=A0AAV2ED67_9ROSI
MSGAQTPPNTPPFGFGGSGATRTTTRQLQLDFNLAPSTKTRCRTRLVIFGNPYYLNPNENMSQSIVVEPFDGTNYVMWSRSIQVVLKTKNKVGFIDGSIPIPPREAYLFSLWDACNTVLLCWLQNSMTKEIRRSVLNHTNSKTLWDELKRRFGLPNALRITNLEDEIQACKQGSRTINQYYTTIKGLLDEYVEFCPITPCTCAPDNPMPCAAVAAFVQKQETDYLIRFLRGLNPEYEVIKTQLLMQRPLPTVSTTIDDLLQHEQKLKSDVAMGGKKGQNLALAVVGYNSRDNTEARGKKFCRFCKMSTHNIEDCFFG